MNEINCEKVLMAKMVEFDGEIIEFSAELVQSHLEICANCRFEIEQMQSTGNALKLQTRNLYEADLWSEIETRIVKSDVSSISYKPFILLGILLLAYKLTDLIPAEDLGLTSRFVPLVLVVALFVFLKENPFRINTELVKEH